MQFSRYWTYLSSDSLPGTYLISRCLISFLKPQQLLWLESFCLYIIYFQSVTDAWSESFISCTLPMMAAYHSISALNLSWILESPQWQILASDSIDYPTRIRICGPLEQDHFNTTLPRRAQATVEWPYPSFYRHAIHTNGANGCYWKSYSDLLCGKAIHSKDKQASYWWSKNASTCSCRPICGYLFRTRLPQNVVRYRTPRDVICWCRLHSFETNTMAE